ncbi:hypothetical protein LAZ67_9001679 [Cordylochernes scorpioides]|uniref:Integrase catalytic domain-containing protein n=1 Tax=Cordylochernes scorpioides TaxID=51811 RepID=A0ABY6KUV8_9ARAC|nr:hypothetical protein LAZ67_9001679 [Cordylochernes scorpioides]
MHGFCDSSELAYSAVCYLRITYENNQIETILLTAKTKVAPIKKITIPRLELCAALMLAQLQSQTTQALPFNIDEQFYWTDSKIVLAWITSESKKWQIFVANRVARIQDLTAAHSWQYISGKQNPADLATRGILPSCLINSKLWWHGPIIQRCEFTPEVNACIKNIPLPRKSRLISLNIFIDSQGILRVGGRLRHSDLDIDQKHPMLIPKDHLVTKLIVMHYHINNLHSGTQLTLYLIRNKFWIPSGRNLIKRVLNQCLVCLKSKSKAIHQIMGDLPKNRLLPGRPFEKIGIDLAGPIQAKPMLKRSKVIFKFYIVLFVCFTTKAIHLEISSDLTAETFLAALKRFISRRGRPTDIYSDNATNFKGASNILKERWKLLNAANIQDFSAIESINWHFIPPSAPNFGGLWEAGIKSVKTILSKTMKSRLFNYEELLTLLAQIEACLNSRPLTFVSNDPNDLTALTPGHFLIGNAMRHDAESDHSTLNLRSRWSLIQPQRDYFWNRWSCEYLHQLQERRKWRTSYSDVNIGDLVMLKEQNKPLQWKLARIVQIFLGEDDHVRVVLLRTPKGLLKRPITKICPLPYKEKKNRVSDTINIEVQSVIAITPSLEREIFEPLEILFPDNLGDMGEEQGEIFHQDIKAIEYRIRMMADYYWKLQRDCEEKFHAEKAYKRSFQVPMTRLSTILCVYYIIARYAAMNMTGSAKTWLNLHKASFTSWGNIKIRLIQDFSLDANKEELRMKLNGMQHWNEPAIRFAEDILVLCNKVDPAMEEETKIEHVIG